MQTENSNINLCERIHCIMQTENSNINLCQKYIALCELKTVTETCLRNILFYAN